MRQIKYILCLCLLVFSVISCKKEEVPEVVQESRTVLFYIVSENSLLGYDNQNIKQLLSSARSMKDNEQIVLYVDNDKTPSIYTINNRTVAEELGELVPEYTYPSDHNSCSGVVLSEFLGYVKTKHKADSYGIVFWSHGSGWIPSNYKEDSQTFARRRSFGVDNGLNTNSSNVGSRMSISEMHDALKSMGSKFDFIFFDCCFMQCVEVDYELRDVAKYIIGSPAEIPGPGAPYNRLVSVFFNRQYLAEQLPRTYYTHYMSFPSYGVIISTCDCDMMDALASKTRTYVQKYKNSILTADYGDVLNYFSYDKYRKLAVLPDFFDINGIFKNVFSAEDYNDWKSSLVKAYPFAFAADKWYSIYPKGNLTMDKEQYGGASMYIPLAKYSSDAYSVYNTFFTTQYFNSQWAKDVWE